MRPAAVGRRRRHHRHADDDDADADADADVDWGWWLRAGPVADATLASSSTDNPVTGSTSAPAGIFLFPSTRFFGPGFFKPLIFFSSLSLFSSVPLLLPPLLLLLLLIVLILHLPSRPTSFHCFFFGFSLVASSAGDVPLLVSLCPSATSSKNRPLIRHRRGYCSKQEEEKENDSPK